MRRHAFSTLASRSRNSEAAWTAATVNGSVFVAMGGPFLAGL
jgi:hypothetical protein